MKLYGAANPMEAHIICGLLKQQHIEAEVRGEGIFGLKGEIPFTEDTDPYIWLLEPHKLEQAQATIKEFLQQQNEQSNWLCEQCGETNGGQFGICWNCSTEHS